MLSSFEAATARLPSAQVLVEYFTPEEERALTADIRYTLRAQKKEFAILPGQSILEVLQDAGIDVP